MRKPIPILISLALAVSCSKSLEPQFQVELPKDGRFRAGASKVDIMPVPYNSDGSCPSGKFCFELPIHYSDELDSPSLPYPAKPADGVSDGCWEWREPGHRQRNSSEIYEGYLDKPDPDPATCREGFVDANRNGQFEALWMGGYDEGRPATSIDTEASIYAKAMVLQQNDEVTAVIGLPFVGFPTLQLAGLRERLAGETNGRIRKENIILYVHHNHSLPDPQGLWGPNLLKNFDIKGPGGVRIGDLLKIEGVLELAFPVGAMNFHNYPYWLWVEDRTADALREALAGMKPAKMRFAERDQPHKEVGCFRKSFQHTDDFRDADGDGIVEAEIDCNEDGVPNTDEDRGILDNGMVDAGVECMTPKDLQEKPVRFLNGDSRMPTVLDFNVYTWQFVSADHPSEVLATFVVWGAHVEAGPGSNTKLTGDYAENVCNFVESKIGGTCLFQIGPQGGLTGPLGNPIPKIDAQGRYVDCDGNSIEGSESSDSPIPLLEGGRSIALVPNFGPDRQGGTNLGRMQSLGRQLAKTSLASVQDQAPMEVKDFDVRAQYALLPMDNPYFYLGGKLEILSGFSLVLRKGMDYSKLTELVYADELPSNNTGSGLVNRSCGPAICIRVAMDLLTLKTVAPDGTVKKAGWLTNPGEVFPEWLVGRAEVEYEYKFKDPTGADKDRKQDLDEMARTGLDPGFPRDLFTTEINPQHYMAIKGLREVAMKDLPEGERYDGFFITAQTQSSLGYQPPYSEFMEAYEGFLDEVFKNVDAIDLILKESGGARKIFHLSENDENFTFKSLLADVKGRYSDVITNYSGPPGMPLRHWGDGSSIAVRGSRRPRRHEQGGGHNLGTHPNVYEETVSLGPRTGVILYNMGHGLLWNGKYGNYYTKDNMPAFNRGDPNTDPEINALSKFNR
ncbi:MAG: hypothetical protein HYT87_13300 [Nitrospirae bacterium]|nr:hypothetical protein [Nitrospirota bacterium]